MVFFENYENNGNVDLQAIELHKKYNFTHITYLAEQDIIRAARLRYHTNHNKGRKRKNTKIVLTFSREYLGLPGQSMDSALCFRDKVIMKDYLNAHLPEEVKYAFLINSFIEYCSIAFSLFFVHFFAFIYVLFAIY